MPSFFYVMITSLTIYQAISTDIYHNLTAEEILCRQIGDDQINLFLWRSQNAVVIGRNQNPWIECLGIIPGNPGFQLARRSSGGGTVYHDSGNLNYSFISTTENYVQERNFSIILMALQSLGIAGVSWDRRQTMWLQGKKISGNSFHFSRNIALHHGTLLINADLNCLREVLSPTPGFEFTSRAVASIPAPVINLTEVMPYLTVDEVADSIAQSCITAFPYSTVKSKAVIDYSTAEWDAFYAKYSSRSWIYGETPRFTVQWHEVMPSGRVEVMMEVSRGRISKVSLSCEQNDERLSVMNNHLQAALLECEFNSSSIVERVKKQISNCASNHCLFELLTALTRREF